MTAERPVAVSTATVAASGGSTPRLLSLDVFRGITIAGMVLVNNPGTWSAVYGPLEHAKWHGWTPTDLIFPFFVYIVGVAMTYSFGKQLARGAGRGELLLKSVKRSAVIFALSLAIGGFPMTSFPGYDLTHMRVVGVLQRIAIAYLISSAIYLYTRGWKARVGWVAAFLLGYWALMMLVPVPGVGAGVLEPGKNLSNWIDLQVLGIHNYKGTATWDPEGLLSTMGAVGTCLLGSLVGTWIRAERSQLEKTVGLFVIGNVLLAAGLIWGGAFPINKQIWTSSYVLFTAGFGSVLLALCYWTADVKGWRWWTKPFVVFGMNALGLYVLSAFVTRLTLAPLIHTATGAITTKTWLFDHLFAPFLSPINASLAFAIVYVMVWLGIMWILYNRKIFIKV
jgi:predicted acyltransferase